MWRGENIATFCGPAGFAQNPAIHRGGDAQRQHVEHQPHDHLAGADRDIHPGQQKVEDDAGQHSRQQADPNHTGYISGEEAGQRAQQNGSFNTNVQNSGALGERLSQRGQQDRPGEPQAGGEPGREKCRSHQPMEVHVRFTR